MKKILNSLDISGAPEINNFFSGIANLVNVPTERETVLKEISDADAYMASAAIKIDAELLSHAKKLKVIGSPSTGTDHIDFELLTKKGITCFDISKEFNLINSFSATSELVFALIFCLVRNLIPAIRDADDGVWSREKHSGYQLLGKTFGIIGLGRLGVISANIAHGYGMKVIACDTKLKNIKNIIMVDKKTLAKESDIVSIHVHLNSDTEGLIDKLFFKNMKNTGIIINTSRGKIVNEYDLLYALKNEIIGGAGLDVIDGEWLTENELFNHPLITYARNNNNLIISPHIGGATKESIYGARVFIAKKIANFFKS